MKSAEGRKEGRKNILQLHVVRGTLVWLAIVFWSTLVKSDARSCDKFTADPSFLFLDAEIGSRETAELTAAVVGTDQGHCTSGNVLL